MARSRLPGSERPRERLARLGAEALSDAELLALLLRTGVRGADVLALSRRLLAQQGGLRGVARAAPAVLCRAPGVGPAKCATLVAAIEIGRRLACHRLREGEAIQGPVDVYKHFYPRLRDAPHERFLVILLDGRHRVLRAAAVSEGTLTASLVHPREVFRPALEAGSAAVVLVHNHPSGDPTPSQEDRSVTERLARAGEILGIRVLDHVIVAERGYRSLREEGAFDLGAEPAIDGSGPPSAGSASGR